jgi:hypothetical protein
MQTNVEVLKEHVEHAHAQYLLVTEDAELKAFRYQVWVTLKSRLNRILDHGEIREGVVRRVVVR